MSGAASPVADAAFNGPTGTIAVPVGTATYHFLNMPLRFSTIEFLAIVTIIFIVARHWGKFINKMV